MIRIALAQINACVGGLKENAKKIRKSIAIAEERESDIIVFPECALTGYPPEDLVCQKHFIQDNLSILRDVAKKTKRITAIVGCIDRDPNGDCYDAAAILSHGKVQGMYHKMHLPNYGVFDEKRYFTPGSVKTLLQYGEAAIALTICEDIWTDKGPAPVLAQEVTLSAIINLSSSPYTTTKFTERKKTLRAQIKSCRAPMAYVNMIGGQDELLFDGRSLVMDQTGHIRAQGALFDEDLLIYDIPIIKIHKKKKPSSKSVTRVIHIKPHHQHHMSPLRKMHRRQSTIFEEIYKGLVRGTLDYVRKNSFQKAVIGLSGGIDSALTAVIACDAIGPENVICVSMPSRYSSKGTRHDAKSLALNLGVTFKEIPIQKIYDTSLQVLASEFKGTPRNIAEENMQARIRGNILMALSNKFGWLVLATGNKSEVSCGYSTLYGDMVGGLMVLKDVYKTMVYALSVYRNKLWDRPMIPKSIITRAPSAELKPRQKDQDVLPPYEILDKILELYVEKRKSYREIVRLGHAEVTVNKVIKMVLKNEYKRRQAAPGIKITQLAFGKDYRFPITNHYKAGL